MSCQRAALAFCFVLLVEEVPEAVHLLVERLESGIGGKESGHAQFLVGCEFRRVFTQDGEGADMVFDFRCDLSAEGHEMVNDDANDVEAIGNDFGVWEPLADQGAVGAGEVDADDLDALAAFKGGDVRS